jgi:ABC-type uncharacterized transport system substrate-binding protein
MAAEAASVVAVLSSETGPYREALAGFQDGLGASVKTFVLSREKPDIPRTTKVVVAFGAKAALGSYPNQATLIYALAPGAERSAQTTIVVRMEPNATQLLSNLKKVHPDLKRLGILWRSPQLTDYIEELRQAGSSSDVAIEGVFLGDNSDIPDQLRRFYGKIDAIWLPPDPLLLNADSLSVFVGFALASRILLFVPTSGLVEQGAVASIGATFREMGRLAGLAAGKAVSGEAQANRIHPVRVEIVINKAVAAQIGLRISEKTLRDADRVLP